MTNISKIEKPLSPARYRSEVKTAEKEFETEASKAEAQNGMQLRKIISVLPLLKFHQQKSSK